MSVAVVRVAGQDIETALERVLGLTGELTGIAWPGASVFLKPNIVAPFEHAITDLRLLAALVKAVRQAGGRPTIGESAGFEFDTAATFRAVGLDRLAAELAVPLLNLDRGEYDQCPTTAYRGLLVARAALTADAVINVPKLKLHSLTGVTLGAKNLMGLLPRTLRRQMHVRGLEKGIACLASAIPVALTIVDALTVTPRAVFARSQPLGLLIGGRHLTEVDGACRQLLSHPYQAPVSWVCEAGLTPPAPLTGLRLAERRLYHWLFRLLYLVDVPFAALTGGSSLVPWAHYLAIRPGLVPRRCDACGECLRVCPADAIDLRRKRIIAARCMRLRCLRCRDVCRSQAIVLRGWRRPREL